MHSSSGFRVPLRDPGMTAHGARSPGMVALLVSLSAFTTPALAACPQELAIYEDSLGQSLTFTPPPAEGQAAEHAFSIRINGQDLQGVVMWSTDPERPNGIVMDSCPEGDVTGEELEICTVWQGVIYGLTKEASAPFLGKRGSDHAEALLLPDFSRSVQAHRFKNSMPSPPKAEDVFRMKACQE